MERSVPSKIRNVEKIRQRNREKKIAERGDE